MTAETVANDGAFLEQKLEATDLNGENDEECPVTLISPPSSTSEQENHHIAGIYYYHIHIHTYTRYQFFFLEGMGFACFNLIYINIYKKTII